MSKIKIVGHASGSGVLTIAAPNTNTDRTITIPDVTGTLLDSGSDLPAANLTGTVADARISALTASKLTGALPAISAANLTAIPAANITGTLPAISATNLTNVPAANITGTLPAISGANLTSVNAINGGRKNLIINGGMQIDQRGTLGSPDTGTFMRSVDGNWFCPEASDGAASYEQIADAPSGTGLSYSQKVTVTTADTSLASDNRLCPTQGTEGYDWNRLEWGTATAKTVAVQFWVKSSVIGTYGFSIRTGSGGMSYTQPYTISSANTWEKKTFTIAGPTSILGGSVSATNGTAWYLIFGLGFGSGFDTGADTTWTAVGNGQGRAAHTNLLATNGATWQLTGFQIEEGSVATDFEHRSFGEELALCQRYYSKSDVYGTAPAQGSDSNSIAVVVDMSGNLMRTEPIFFPVQMRASPTVTRLKEGALGGGSNGQWSWYQSGVWTYGSFTAGNITPEKFTGHINGTSGAGDGNSYWMHINWYATAEL